MRAIVDQDLCTGCEMCVDTCPDVFEITDDIATAKVDEIPPDAIDCAQQAAEECPVEAITIEE